MSPQETLNPGLRALITPHIDISRRLFVGYITLSEPLICAAAHPSNSVDAASAS